MVAVLFKAGDQVPVIPLLDVVGKEKLPPEQMAATWLKVGVTFGLTVLVGMSVARLPHPGISS